MEGIFYKSCYYNAFKNLDSSKLDYEVTTDCFLDTNSKIE